MKRATAIRHLVEMAEVATEALRFRETQISWPLEEMWVGGELLRPADTLEAGSVVLVLDVPAEELPWLARHPRRRVGRRPASAGQATQARELPARRSAGLGPRPPAACPVWTARDGTDHATIDALRARRLDTLAIDEPTDGELTAEMPHELERSRRHLRAILESYWDPHLATRPQRPR